MTASVDIRHASDRRTSTTDWLDSKHSFSFGGYYDPSNTHHGLLVVNNDDVVAPGTGFDTHPHRDMEIVTWVLQGSLAHRDSMGNSGVIYPGLAQRMSAGSGVLHSEKNGSTSERVHFVQMWVVPDESGITPGYQQAEIDDGQLDRRAGHDRVGHARRCGHHHPQQAGGVARRSAAAGRRRPAAGSAVPAPVRTPRRGDARRCRTSSRR